MVKMINTKTHSWSMYREFVSMKILSSKGHIYIKSSLPQHLVVISEEMVDRSYKKKKVDVCIKTVLPGQNSTDSHERTEAWTVCKRLQLD